MEKETYVTPQLLLQLGFCLPRDTEYNQAGGLPDYRYPKVCFVERACRRQAICLILDGDQKTGYDVDIHVQENVGMPYYWLPHNWTGLEVERLNDLYRFSAGTDLPGYKYMRFTKNG